MSTRRKDTWIIEKPKGYNKYKYEHIQITNQNYKESVYNKVRFIWISGVSGIQKRFWYCRPLANANVKTTENNALYIYLTIQYIFNVNTRKKCPSFFTFFALPSCKSINTYKAFDSIEIWSFLAALDSRYTTIIKNIYEQVIFTSKQVRI